jgi:hypothetical protein
MIKISISKGQTAIVLESDGHELKTAMVDAYDLFKQMQESNPAIPFEQNVEVKNVSADEKVKLTDEEFDMIEKAHADAEKRRAESEKEMATAQIEIAKAAEAKRIAEEKAAEEKEAAKKAEKAEDDAENEARAKRAKARKKRAFLHQAALLDEEVTSDMIAQAESDIEEEKEDNQAQAIYNEKYAAKEKTTEEKVETPAPKAEEKVATPAPKAEEKETAAPAPKAEEKVEPKKEEAEPAKKQSTKEEVIEEIKLMFNSGKTENKQALKLARKGVEMLKAVGIEKCEAMVEIMTEVTIQKTLWDMLVKRPEVMVAKLGFSKSEADQIVDIMK